MREDPKPRSTPLRKVAIGLGLTTVFCAGLMRDEDGEVTTEPVQKSSVPRQEDSPHQRKGELLISSVNIHEDLAEGQRSFSEKLAICIQDNFSPRDGMSTVECSMVPLPHSAFPGEEANAQDFPSAYVHKFSAKEPEPTGDFTLNKVQCFAYDSQDNPIARSSTYAGPIVERDEDEGWGAYKVHYGQVVGEEVGKFGFGKADKVSIPYPLYDNDLALVSEEFEGVTDDEALQSLCLSTVDKLSPRQSPFGASVDVPYFVTKNFEFTEAMHGIGFETLGQSTDLDELMRANNLLNYFDPQNLALGLKVGVDAIKFYRPDEMSAIDCTLFFDIAAEGFVSCHEGNPLVFTSEGQISEVVGVAKNNSCVTTYASTLNALMDGGELEEETICD